MNHALTSNDSLTNCIKEQGIGSWCELKEYVHHLPYGRNRDRKDLSLVIAEQRGTCSSKHALLKQTALLNAIPGVSLILGVYKMNRVNTPNIGNVLAENGLEYIPEAHCYLKINGVRTDITTIDSDIAQIQSDIISEIEIQAAQVNEFKVVYHRDFLRTWIAEKQIKLSLKELWAIREACIANLSN